MDLNINILKLLNVLFVIIIVVLLFMYLIKPGGTTVVKETIKRDTSFVEIKTPPIVIEKAVGKIKYVKQEPDTITIGDTTYVYKEPEFISSIDSIINNDTILVSYYYPSNLFDINIRKKPDTIRYIQTEVVKEKEAPFWEKAAYVVGGLIVGYIIGK